MGLRDTNTNPYEMQRKQVSQRLQAQGQEQQGALNRRFAQLGGGPSGAAIKAQQNLQSQLGQQREEALGNIASQEALAQKQEEQFNKQFGLQERAQKTAEEQFGKQFGLQERAQQVGEEQFGKQFGLQEKQLAEALTQGEFGRTFAKEQFSADRADQAFNKAVAGAQLKGSQLGRFSNLYDQFGGGELKTAPDAALFTHQIYGSIPERGYKGGWNPSRDALERKLRGI